jgi:hypothetical protein
LAHPSLPSFLPGAASCFHRTCTVKTVIPNVALLFAFLFSGCTMRGRFFFIGFASCVMALAFYAIAAAQGRPANRFPESCSRNALIMCGSYKPIMSRILICLKAHNRPDENCLIVFRQ